MKKLILNVDDFGVSHAANAAVLNLYQQGKITSASLMAGTSAYDEAVEMIRRYDLHSIGAHLYVTCEYAADNPRAFCGLTDIASVLPDGRMTETTPPDTVWDAVEREAEAQLAMMQADGVPLTHLDCHMYALFPHGSQERLRRMARLCRQYGIRKIRFGRYVRELPPYYLVVRSGRKRRFSDRLLLRRSGLHILDYSYMMKNDELDAEAMLHRFTEFVRALPQGVTELHCHPAVEDAEELQNDPFASERIAEYHLLADNDIAGICKQYGVTLVSWETK